MKDVLKYAGILLALAIALIVLSEFEGCPKETTYQPNTITVPKDTNFVPIENQTYQPPSVPVLSNKRSGFKLPEGVKETDVKKVISVEVKTDSAETKTIDIIETKDGEIFIRKDSLIRSVKVTRFEPPVFSFGWRIGAGVSVGYNDRINFSPSGVFAPVEWYGWLHAPIVQADLNGVGVGAQFRLYHDVYVGAVKSWNYNEGEQIKAVASFMF
jgi:hypothetical protein